MVVTKKGRQYSGRQVQ